MPKSYKMLIGGEFVGSELALDVVNPATGKVFTTVPRATPEQVEKAITFAKAAQIDWAAKSKEERRACLHKFADELDARTEEIARVLVQEQGKTLEEATAEVTYSGIFVRYFADADIPVEIVQDDADYRIEVHHKPLGVVAGITPWNFPMLIPAHKMAPAIVMGNCFILKAAPTTPLCSLIIGEIAAETLPAGVVSVLVDDNDVGPILTEHPDIAKVSFTGSTQTGKRIMEAGASTIKRLTLELGGNDAGIILDDADIEKTADGIMASAFGNCGQVCVAMKRVYVSASIYDDLCTALAKRAGEIHVGDGLDQGTNMGPLQNKSQFEKAKHYLEIAHRDGEVIAGGSSAEDGGYFVQPTIVSDINASSPLVVEEQFAPILPIVKYDDLDLIIEEVNNTEYGLGGSVWSSSIDKATEVAHRVESGMIWINHATHFGPHIPFGGAKQSGIGVEFTTAGMAEFAQKTVISVAH